MILRLENCLANYSIVDDVMYAKISGQAGTPKGFLATGVELSSETFAGFLGAVMGFSKTVPRGWMSAAACVSGPWKASFPSTAAFWAGAPERITQPG
ncbi:hypothetical protein ACVI1T_006369 [Rhizobium redzepovicii]